VREFGFSTAFSQAPSKKLAAGLQGKLLLTDSLTPRPAQFADRQASRRFLALRKGTRSLDWRLGGGAGLKMV